ncbi:hypothetical protein [Georgenia sp. SYP-B2076]|uniref:hypothetical protein n=1 Tax=Georgenia sp. SYP-B2076 TaxID=2495881 RepID=UPI000F8F0B78|nr:hypothetical protein [Georgenia sp. SYP-B2076]
MTLGLAAALLGTLGYGAGSVLQAAATARASGPAALRHPLYLAGLGCDLVAWLASLLALRSLPLFVVQALLAGSLAVTVLLARVFLGTRMRGRDLLAVVAVAAALAVVAAAGGAQSAGAAPAGFTGAVLAGLGACVLALLVLYRRGGWPALAAVAGAAFSGAALCARAIQGPGPAGAGPVGLLTDPLVWAIPAFGLVGLMAYARSLERGNVGAATAVLWVVEILVPALVGVWALGDSVRPGWQLAAAAAIALAVAGCVTLALSPSQAAETGYPRP